MKIISDIIRHNSGNSLLKSNAAFMIANITLSIMAFSFLVALESSMVSGLGPGSPAFIAAQTQDYFKISSPPHTDPRPTGLVPPTDVANAEKIAELDSRIKSLEAAGKTKEAAAAEAEKQSLTKDSGGITKTLTALGNNIILGSLFWGAVAGGIVYLGSTMFGTNKDQAKALSFAVGSGVAVFNFGYRLTTGYTLLGQEQATWGIASSTGTGSPVTALFGTGPNVGMYGFLTSAVVAAGVAFAVYAAIYKKESKKTVAFSCDPWEAPIGGADCEKCNKDAMKPCSEYRCASLGQACKLLNAGTGNETCAWVNPKDVSSPGIAPWESVLTKDHKYADVRIRPPGSGVEPGRMKITGPATDGCIKAFTPLRFGVTTTEPAQCKIDYNHTRNFESMSYFMGETNLFLYNHSQVMSLPGPKNLEIAAPELKNDGTYTLYVRCKDANGNENIDEFAVRFCVEKGPDTTPARIEATSIVNNMPVGFGTEDVGLDVYLNEPADCKWSREDRDYNNMENSMKCSNQIFEMNANLLYTCKANLTGIRDRQTNDFYFRCLDQPGAPASDRIPNTESFKFTLRGTEPLKIIDIKPNGTIQGSGDFVSVFLEVETAFGEHEGDASCFYSTTGIEKDFIKFFETGTNKHRQRQDLPSGDYKYYIRCIDLGGNADSNISEFTVSIDRTPPLITRAYQDNQLLKIVTDEKSSCSYSNKDCRYSLGNGIDMPYSNTTEHFAEWKTDTNYYIKCSDTSGNEPLPDSCSIIVRVYGKI